MFSIITFSVLLLMTNGLDFNNEPRTQELLQIIQTMNVTIGKLIFIEIRTLRLVPLSTQHMLTVSEHLITFCEGSSSKFMRYGV